MSDISANDFAAATGISAAYARMLLADPPKRTPGERLAFEIWERTGAKMGRLSGLSDADIRTLLEITARRDDR